MLFATVCNINMDFRSRSGLDPMQLAAAKDLSIKNRTRTVVTVLVRFFMNKSIRSLKFFLALMLSNYLYF